MPWTRDEMAARAAKELKDGYYVNLGIGIPTLVANNIPKGMTVTLQSENGMLGIGPFPYPDEVDADLINAGKQTPQLRNGLVRSDRASDDPGRAIDLAVLGAMKISRKRHPTVIPGKISRAWGGDGPRRRGQKNHRCDDQSPRTQPEIHPRMPLPLTGRMASHDRHDLAVFARAPCEPFS